MNAKELQVIFKSMRKHENKQVKEVEYMTGILIEYLVGLYFIGMGIDEKPNWFKIVFGAILTLLAFFRFSIVN